MSKKPKLSKDIRYNKRMPYNLNRFSRSPESSMESAYLALSDASLQDDERRRLAIVVSLMRGLFDLLRFVQTELSCTRRSMDEIEEIMQRDRPQTDKEYVALRAEIEDWINASYRWRQDGRFKVKVSKIAEFSEDWTKKIVRRQNPDLSALGPMTMEEMDAHIHEDKD